MHKGVKQEQKYVILAALEKVIDRTTLLRMFIKCFLFRLNKCLTCGLQRALNILVTYERCFRKNRTLVNKLTVKLTKRCYQVKHKFKSDVSSFYFRFFAYYT